MLALSLAGCGGNQVASVKGGECKAFKRAAQEVCGITVQDQYIMDVYIATGVSACGWARPAARTPSCQQLRDEIAQLHVGAKPVVTVVKKKKWWQKL